MPLPVLAGILSRSADRGAQTVSRKAWSAPRRSLIALLALLTVADLFAAQAILPALTAHYRVSPATMALAVNACTLGMAIAGLAVAVLSRHINRGHTIVASLTLLAVPTMLLALAPDTTTFAALRIVQGLLMATAFTLTLAYLGEELSPGAAAAAVAAYVTGNVASNLLGRLLSASVAQSYGLKSSFAVFAVLNLLGAVLAHRLLRSRSKREGVSMRATGMQAMSAFAAHLRNPALRATVAIGFCILFAFIGTFTFVSFVLMLPPLSLDMMQSGLVYLVFLPSIATTPLAGRLVVRIGARRALWLGLGMALAGLPLLLAGIAAVLLGLTLVGIGTFLAQAVAAGTAGRVAADDPGAASGLYLAGYFLGGLAGSAVLGSVFQHWGWSATVVGIGIALAVAMAASLRLEARTLGTG